MTIVTVNFRREVRVSFLEYLYVDRQNHTFLLVCHTDRYFYFLTMFNGLIELIREGRDSIRSSELVPISGSLRHAAEVYHRSHLVRTEEAEEVMLNILANKDILMIPNEAPSREERAFEKANTVYLKDICQEVEISQGKAKSLLIQNGLGPENGFWRWHKSKLDSILQCLQN